MKTQTVPVKLYLPKEVEVKDIIDQGGLEIEFDSERSCYYVYNNEVVLEPMQTVFFDIEVEDVWMVPEDQIDELRRRTRYVVEQLQDTQYIERAQEESESIYSKLNEMTNTQNDDTVTRNQHIGYYRTNLEALAQVKQQLEKMEKLLTFAGGPPVPEMLKESELKLDAPSTTTTWMIIFIILIFIAVLALVFFFTWQRQKRATDSFFSQARESAFPKAKQPGE
jgi:FtsZ-interacting cell division protein ZipA